VGSRRFGMAWRHGGSEADRIGSRPFRARSRGGPGTTQGDALGSPVAPRLGTRRTTQGDALSDPVAPRRGARRTTQGDALGFPVAPRWGTRRTARRRERVAGCERRHGGRAAWLGTRDRLGGRAGRRGWHEGGRPPPAGTEGDPRARTDPGPEMASGLIGAPRSSAFGPEPRSRSSIHRAGPQRSPRAGGAEHRKNGQPPGPQRGQNGIARGIAPG